MYLVGNASTGQRPLAVSCCRNGAKQRHCEPQFPDCVPLAGGTHISARAEASEQNDPKKAFPPSLPEMGPALPAPSHSTVIKIIGFSGASLSFSSVAVGVQHAPRPLTRRSAPHRIGTVPLFLWVEI
ncbi:hypothetical protein NL676_027535 [Syzygium grande]|nr:hypothetical protein NL676_027535 [Syzygium grande]